jgi:hypothetical protein
MKVRHPQNPRCDRELRSEACCARPGGKTLHKTRLKYGLRRFIGKKMAETGQHITAVHGTYKNF